MAISQSAFDPDLQKLTTDISTLISLNSQLIAALKVAQAQAATPDDLTTEDSSVNSSDASVTAAIAAAQAALAPVPAPTTGS